MTKIGFNNFKAFGPQMQYFSKKPITLIYGPNSIGKSSFLHSQLYLDYLRKTIPNIDLKESYFAGDKFDLGGFKSFIHKHDLSKSINFELSITNKKEIEELLFLNNNNIPKLTQDDFESLDFSTDNIENFLNQLVDNTFKMKDILKVIKAKNKKISSFKLMEKYPKNEESKATYDVNLKNYEETLAFIFIFMNKDEDIKEMKNKKEIYNEMKLHLEQCTENIEISNDKFIQSIILSKETKANNIKMFFDYLKYLKSINNIKLKFILENINRDMNINLEYYLDDEILFKTKTNYINEKHNLIKLIKNMFSLDYSDDSKIKELYKKVKQSHFRLFDLNILDYKLLDIDINDFSNDFMFITNNYLTISDIHRVSVNYFNNLKYFQKIQYYGPLRFYPERSDLVIKKQKEKINKPKRTKKQNFIDISNPSSIFNIKFFILFKLSFWKKVLSIQGVHDLINEILPEKFRINKNESKTSKLMWDKLIMTKDIQNMLSKWLSSEKKLKSNYQLKIIDNDKYKELIFIDIKKQTEVTPKDMGLGISQMLPILISTMSSNNTKIYIEQPELHLHPAIQMELMDEFIKSKNTNNNEFILESHSEHMLLRTMKRLKQTSNGTIEDESLKLTPEDVCLLYVDNDGDQTYIQELRLSKNGKLLDHWPNGFFEEGYKERFL